MEEAFDYVVNEVAKIALKKLNMDENDPTSIFVMGRILVGISYQESDRKIASGVSEILDATALSLRESHIKAIVAEVQEKCANQVLALQSAYNDIENGSSAEEALANIQELL